MNSKGFGRKSRVRISGTNPKFSCSAMKNLVQDRQSPGRELNQSPSEHVTGMVAIRPRRSVVAQEKQENFCRFPTKLTRSVQNTDDNLSRCIIFMITLQWQPYGMRKRRGTEEICHSGCRNVLY
jgi:hypothetical protein